MAKKRKKKRERVPPLSLLDKGIYWCGMILVFLVAFFAVFIFEETTDAIAFRDAAVVAYNNDMNGFFVAPALLYGLISALIFLGTALDIKKPLFGNRKIRYGQDPWDKDTFPLFDPRRKTVPVKPSEKRFRRRFRMIWAVGMVVCLLLVPLGLFGRDCLTEDNCIMSYNALNMRSSDSYTVDDFSHLTIRAKYVSGYRSRGYWKYEIEIEMSDGTSYIFSNRDFDVRESGMKERCLRKMLEIKALFPTDSVKIIGANKLEKVVDYLNLNEEQAELLRELFRQEAE